MLSPASSISSAGAGSTLPRRIALIDANAYYCQVERHFDARLRGKPLVVLGSSDGCVVARTPEAKALGIKMGDPWFKLQHLVREHGLVARSANLCLYGEMSARMISVIQTFSPQVAPYSIDETFAVWDELRLADVTEYGRQVVQRMQQWLGLPVCVGVGTTPTLAKMANRLAKSRAEWGGVCDLSSMADVELQQLLDTVPVEDVWGIGPRLSADLATSDITTAGALRACDPAVIRRRYSVVAERTVRELQGVECIDFDATPQPRDQIMCSRTFGRPIQFFDSMMEALADHVSMAAVKLRKQGSVAGAIQVFHHTSRHRVEDPQYYGCTSVELAEATSDTAQLIAAAKVCLKRTWRTGYRFTRGGVMLMGLSAADRPQTSLFGASDQISERSANLMQSIDALNARFGRNTVLFGNVRSGQAWKGKANFKSPYYTTRWSDLLEVKA